MNNNEAVGRIRFMLDVGGSDGFTSADKEALNMAINALTAEISAPPKSNADLYDLLCDMNANFMNGEPHCVLEAITGANMICKHESCNHCIAEWLKQEVSEDATD